MVDPPSSTTALASFKDDIRGGGLVILGIEDTALVAAISSETFKMLERGLYELAI